MNPFKASRAPGGLHVEMAAALTAIDLASEETKSFLREQGLEDHSFNVLLVMREALSNAVIHGSGADEEKIVTYDLRFADEELTMRIEDQGPGFRASDIRTESPPDQPGGRGLTIMRKYFDDVQYNERGNVLVLTKRCGKKGVLMSDIQQNGDAAVITPGRDIVSSMAQEFKKELKGLVDSGVTMITVDLEGVEMVDSIGMGLLIATHNSLAKNGGKLKVANPSEDILRLLKTMRLDKHFEVQES